MDNWRRIKHFGTVSNPNREFRKELNLMEWHDNPAKYDLRVWDYSGEGQPKQGVTLTENELRALYDIMTDIFTGLGDPTTTEKEYKEQNVKLKKIVYALVKEKLEAYKETDGPKVCLFPSCKEPVYIEGLCKYHYSYEKYESK